MTNVTFTTRAYSKMMLHACKYPHKAINGVLLGVVNSDGAAELRIVDAVPLFHQCLGLAPMLEIAFTQVDAYAQRNNLNIVGYYQVNEHIEDCTPDTIAYKIAEKVAEQFPRAILAVGDNQRMDAECKAFAFDVYTHADSKWLTHKQCQLIGGDTSLALVSELIVGKTYQSLSDFDNHLDDVTQDWLNLPINKLAELTAE